MLGGIFIVILDVGCGSRFKGDVNTDIFRGGWNRQEADQYKGEFVDPHKIPNFVVASAEFLPSMDNYFDVVLSCHTIEHVSNPFRMLAELVRVSKRKGLLNFLTVLDRGRAVLFILTISTRIGLSSPLWF